MAIEQAFDSVLGRGGHLEGVISGYEFRPQQVQMANLIWQAFSDGRVLMVEAGTGTGKSLAYLVPALALAAAGEGPVVVSTHTLNLQDQIYNNDLPLAAGAVGFEPQVVVFRGWRNYICRCRLAHFHRQLPLLQQEVADLCEELRRWSAESSSGVREDFPGSVPDEVWDQVCADSELCLGRLCEHRGVCFRHQARRRLQKADLIVVNHHLLCADGSIKQQSAGAAGGVLPDFLYLVVDEAHHLEEVAASYFGSSLSLISLVRLARRVSRRGGSALVPDLAHLLAAQALTLPPGELQERILLLARGALPQAAESLEAQARSFFGSLRTAAQNVARNNGAFYGETLSLALGRDEDDEGVPLPEVRPLLKALKELCCLLEEAGAAATRMTGDTRGGQEAEVDYEGDGNSHRVAVSSVALAEDDFKLSLQAAATSLAEASAVLQRLSEPSSPDHVNWVTATPGHIELRTAPVEAGPLLQQGVFAGKRSVVLTSATLSVAGDFAHLKSRLGLSDEQVDTCVMDSPFDYQSQVLLAVPTELPDPDGADYCRQLAAFVVELLRITRGRAFLLFTSYAMLEEVSSLIREAALPYPLLVQGEAGRGALVQRFIAAGDAVLLGTDSFWEGVDVPGDALSCVVLARLPFPVPSDPLVRARMKRVEQQGHSSFAGYMLPQAILKFRQGFGRLVRRKTDRGVVVVCDARIVKRRYGRLFLQSIPACPRVTGSIFEVLRRADYWLRA